MKPTLDQLVELAQQVEIEDPIDWGMLAVSEDEAYRLMALGVLDMFDDIEHNNKESAMLSVIVKLTVENFVLNLKLLNR
jgi:hypothetical protein